MAQTLQFLPASVNPMPESMIVRELLVLSGTIWIKSSGWVSSLLLSVSPSNLILSSAWITKLIQNVSKTINQILETPVWVSQWCYSLLGSCKYHPAFTYAEECKCQFYRFINVKKLCLYLAPDKSHENLLHLTSGREWHFQPVLSQAAAWGPCWRRKHLAVPPGISWLIRLYLFLDRYLVQNIHCLKE